jgi:hypothetical protein
VKYADNNDGSTGFSDAPLETTKYIGIAPNKTVAAESNNRTDYTWSLFRGEDGLPGEPGPQGPPGISAPEVTVLEDTSISILNTASNQKIFSLQVPAGNYRFEAQFNFNVRASQFLGGEPFDRGTRVVASARRGTTVITGEIKYDPSSTTFGPAVFSRSGVITWDIPSVAGDTEFTIYVAVVVNGSFTSVGISGSGFLRASEI